MRGVRAHALLRAGYGLMLVCKPARMAGLFQAPPDDPAAITVARVLGARHLVQAAVTIAAPVRKVVVTGAVIDALHGFTDAMMAGVDPRWRHAASIDAAVAFSSAAAAVASCAAIAGRTTG